MDDSPKLRRLIYRYVLALFDTTAQHAACNRLHALEERCARWLLMTHDRVEGDVLLLKQQFLAEMLGVHRPAVTLAAGALQKAGIIRYSRGKVTVLDRAALEDASCECYAIVTRRVEELARRRDLGGTWHDDTVRTSYARQFANRIWHNELLAFSTRQRILPLRPETSGYSADVPTSVVDGTGETRSGALDEPSGVHGRAVNASRQYVRRWEMRSSGVVRSAQRLRSARRGAAVGIKQAWSSSRRSQLGERTATSSEVVSSRSKYSSSRAMEAPQ